jgi:hypothetical protein
MFSSKHLQRAGLKSKYKNNPQIFSKFQLDMKKIVHSTSKDYFCSESNLKEVSRTLTNLNNHHKPGTVGAH